MEFEAVPPAALGLDIGQQCMQAVNMIDDLLKGGEDDEEDYSMFDLNRYSSTSSTGVRLHAQDEELKKVRERAEIEREQSLKQF